MLTSSATTVMTSIKRFLCALLVGASLTTSILADDLNCELCHKYKGLSRIDEEGNFKLYFVNEHLFNSGPHSKNTCLDCHVGITEVPHKEVKAVDCGTKCHMTEPSSDLKFSHKSMQEVLDKSVHSKLDEKGKLKEYAEDYPDCKGCHEEPLYRPLHKEVSVKERDIARCQACHATGKFAKEIYNHVSTRFQKFQSPKVTIAACARCHEDKGFRERHKQGDVINSYKETFHAKLIYLGSEKTPDCIDCHVVRGENSHLIEAKKVSTSAVHANNVANTCTGSSCHDKAGENIAGFKTHVTYEADKYPLQFGLLLFFRIVLTAVLYGFILIVFLELLRRLFPYFTWAGLAKRIFHRKTGGDQ